MWIVQCDTYVEFEVLTAVVMKSSIFWDITPCSPLKVKRVSRENVASIQGRRISQARNQIESRWQAEPSTGKKEATFSSETLVDFQRNTQRYIAGDRTLQWDACWFQQEQVQNWLKTAVSKLICIKFQICDVIEIACQFMLLVDPKLWASPFPFIMISIGY
jgi:hypothetical protein